MNLAAISRRKQAVIATRSIIFVLALTPVLFTTPRTHAQDAGRVLKAMSDYVTLRPPYQ